VSSPRGVYRSIFSALADDPDFRRLTPQARHTLLTLRISREAGAACIWLLEPATLARRTGYTIDDVLTSLTELSTSPSAEKPWLFLEGELVWLRNGLRHDPTSRLTSPKHRQGIMNVVASLPRSPLVAKFCRYYKIPYPFGRLPKAKSKASDTVSPPIPSPIPNTDSESDSDASAGSQANGIGSNKKSRPEVDIPPGTPYHERVRLLRRAEGRPAELAAAGAQS